MTQRTPTALVVARTSRARKFYGFPITTSPQPRAEGAQDTMFNWNRMPMIQRPEIMTKALAIFATPKTVERIIPATTRIGNLPAVICNQTGNITGAVQTVRQ